MTEEQEKQLKMYDSLKEVLNRTQSNLRTKAEVVLKSVENNKINTLPAITNYSQQSTTHAGMVGSGAYYPADVNQTLAARVDAIQRSYAPSHSNPHSQLDMDPHYKYHSTPATHHDGGNFDFDSASVGIVSPQRSGKSMRRQHRPVMQRMHEAKEAELLSQPHRSDARQYINGKYGFARSRSSSSLHNNTQQRHRRPIGRYGHASGTIARSRPSAAPKILPKLYRKDPKAFPLITPDDAREGILKLVNKGMIPSFVDVGPAFNDQAPLRQKAATFHNFNDQFQKTASFVAPHSFNLSNVKLDLAETLFDQEQHAEDMARRSQNALAGTPEQLLLQGPEDHHDNHDTHTHTDFPFDPTDTAQTFITAAGLDMEGLPYDDNNNNVNIPHSHALVSSGSRNYSASPVQLAPTKIPLPVTNFAVDFPGAPQAAQRSAYDEDQERKIRDYDELLDTYSLHQFVIRKGKTLSSTPEFLSFRRKYAYMWGQVENIIRLLEDFMINYSINLAYVNGQKVVALAEDDLHKPQLTELLDCLENVDKVSILMKIPGQRYIGDDGPDAAATKLAATYKMHRQRQLYLQHRHRCALARMIQAAWSRYITLQKTRQEIARRWQVKLAGWRLMWGKWKNNWSSFSSRERVIIHLPSLSLQSYQRENMFNFPLRQNSQMSRLCGVKDPNVHVLYISPYELNTDIHHYYLKLLEVGGVTDAMDRIKVMVPENYTRFPEHFSLAKLALYSPKLIKKIRQFIRGRPACIVPMELGPEDLQLAVELNLPLMSAEPDVANLFSSKSGAKRIFQAAHIAVPPGAHDVYDEEDFYNYFAKLIVDNIEVSRWVFKIDNEFGGRGIAYCDPGHLKSVNALRRDKEMHPQRWGLPEIMSEAHERVLRGLKKSIATSATVAFPNAYRSNHPSISPWDMYARAFFRVGGVIEACPQYVIGSPSANLYIEPDGTVTVTSTHDQLFSSPYIYAGATFPSAAPADLLHEAAVRIGRVCYKEKIVGYLGVDFVVYLNPATEEANIWAVDLNIRMTSTQATFNLFDFLMGGTYHKTLKHQAARQGLAGDGGSSVDGHGNEVFQNFNRASYMVTKPEKKKKRRGSRRGSRAGLSSRGDDGMSVVSGSSFRSDGSFVDGGLIERTYTVVDYIYQPNLSSLQFGSFFNMCRLKGVSFDLRSRAGTAFLMSDSLAAGTLGLLCVGENLLNSLEALVNGLSFLVEQAGSLKLGSHVYREESNLNEIIIAAKALLKAQTDAANQDV